MIQYQFMAITLDSTEFLREIVMSIISVGKNTILTGTVDQTGS